MIELNPQRRHRRKKLTDKQVRDLPKEYVNKKKKRVRGRHSKVDPELADHIIRVMPDSANVYYAATRNPYGKMIWHRIGRADQITIEESREAAREAIKRIKAGKPAVEPVPPEPTSFKNVAEDWFAKTVVKDKHITQGEVRRCLERYVYPKWAIREFVSVRRKDIVDLCDALDDSSGRRQSDVVFRIISRITGWYSLRDETYVNPIIKGMRPAEDKPRKRVLFDDEADDFVELRAVWKAAEANGTFGAFIRLALLTAQRRAVLLNMKWSDLNGERGDVWTIPHTDDREKSHGGALKLPKQAMAIIERLPRFKGNPYVFAGRGGKPIAGISGLKAKLDKASGVKDWTIHDARRTARSLLSRAGIDRDTAERVLGHTVGDQTERTYDVYGYREEKAHALNALASLIETIVNPPDGAKVVPMKGPRRRSARR
jgi:integrase